MNKVIADAFTNAFLNVMPMLGMAEASLKDIGECDRKIDVPGVIMIIGITGGLHGNVIFGLNEECARMIAAGMMGMELGSFDEMAQSAISELSNMLAANACIELSGAGITADISTPTLMSGQFTATASFNHVIRIEMSVNGFPFFIYISLEEKRT